MAERIRIGGAMRAVRTSRDRTLMEVGDALGISHQALSLYEGGHRLPNVVLLTRLAAYYGVSVDCLIGRRRRSK